MVSGSPDVSNSFVSPYSNSFVSQSGLWCPALWMSPIHLSPLIAIHLSPSLAGGVRLSGCLQFLLFPFIAIHLSPSLAGGVRLSACLQFICLPLKHFICLPVWLVASGSSDVSNSYISPSAIHLSPSLADGVWLSGCLQFICLPL